MPFDFTIDNMKRVLLMMGILLAGFATYSNSTDMSLCWSAVPEEDQFVRPSGEFDKPLNTIRLSDPAILADKKSQMYYMTGTGGMMWRSKDLKMWDGPYRVTEFDKDSWMGPRPMIWAAELHLINGKYYYFATFTNSST